VESGMNHRVLNETHIQRTKTIDIGLMQINSGALPMLAKEGITQKDLIDNPCLNVRVGARILAAKFKREGANWDGVGAYNAGCSELKGEECQRARNAYTTKVWKALNKAAGQVSSQIDTNTEVVRLLKHGAGSTPATAQMSRIASIDVASTDLPNTLE
jgi:soluble lytic murein transglycosylase-like protein